MNQTPQPFYIPLNRPRFMRAISLVSAGFTLPGFFAEALDTTAPTALSTGEGRDARGGYHSVGFRVAMIPAK